MSFLRGWHYSISEICVQVWGWGVCNRGGGGSRRKQQRRLKNMQVYTPRESAGQLDRWRVLGVCLTYVCVRHPLTLTPFSLCRNGSCLQAGSHPSH